MPTRVPEIAEVYRPQQRTSYRLPLYLDRISAGFPSPADDYQEGKLDLNEHLIPNPLATFFLRVAGDSMVEAGIHPGDLIIVDRAIEPRDGKVVVAVVDGELTLKRLRYRGGQPQLVPDNPQYPALAIGEDTDCRIWGVVLHAIHSP